MILIPISVGSCSLVGGRRTNQDRAFVSAPWAFILDGVGGSRDGAAAAQVALGTLLREAALMPGRYATAQDQKNAALQLVERAHDAVLDALGQRDGNASGSTTLSLVHVQPRNEAYADVVTVSIGDSPVWAAPYGAQPVMMTAAPEGPPSRHLAGALGWATHHPQLHSITLAIPGRIVLATDGLLTLDSALRNQIMSDPVLDPQQCATTLCQAALHMPTSRDNISVVVINIGADTESPTEYLMADAAQIEY